MRKILIFSLLILLLVFLPAGVAYADSSFDRVIGEGETVEEDLVIFGGSLVVEEGATVEGDVSVFGGTADLAGHINGDVAIFGGTVDLTGTIDGNMVVFGGSLDAGSSADIDGDCVLVGGSVSGDGRGEVNCVEVGEFPGVVFPALVNPPTPPELPKLPEVPDAPARPAPPIVRHDRDRGFFGAISTSAGWSLLLGMVALAVGYLAPNQLDQVSHTLRKRPAASGVVGVLTVIAVPTLVTILLIISAILIIVCIGLLGFPIALALMIAFAVGMVLGWIAAGTLLGQRLARWLKMSNRSLPVTAALGTAVLTLATGLLGSLPFLLGGWFWTLAGILIGCAGLGAVALTRFGTRSYPVLATASGEKVETVLETLPDEDESSGGEADTVPKPPVDQG
jgi:hypothetical protein